MGVGGIYHHYEFVKNENLLSQVFLSGLASCVGPRSSVLGFLRQEI